MNRTYDVVVMVPGSLVASRAYHLKCNGVALLERRSLADGGTGKSTAIVRYR